MGDARASSRPPTSQKWRRNKQAGCMGGGGGGGAVTPCTWRLYIKKDTETFERISNMVKTLRSVQSFEGCEDMQIRVSQPSSNKYRISFLATEQSQFENSEEWLHLELVSF